MKWLIWNVRGLNKPLKQKEMDNYLRKNKVSLAELLETKVKTAKFQTIINTYAKC